MKTDLNEVIAKIQFLYFRLCVYVLKFPIIKS